MKRDSYSITNRLRPAGPFASNLRLLMRRRSIDVVDLAALLGMSPRRLRRLYSGDTLPHYFEIPEIAARLRVEPEHLAWAPTEKLADHLRQRKQETTSESQRP